MGFFRDNDVPDGNPPEDEIRCILDTYRTVAVVGLSDNPLKASYEVAEFLKGRGYRIIPVNPAEDRVLDEQCYPDLQSIPVPVEIVQIFRKSSDVPGIVEGAISIGAKVVWMQLGIVNNAAARMAREAGLKVVQSRCMRRELESRDPWH
ncbi:MAG TPA: CoA-binding protein [Deltaproteobacteria bacterium]|nr:CoA-binding protein [Deltaproteobacteria bacterium]HOI07819.1 CoA-binding protein [Deltaproteobacteria bacterium]